MTDLWIQYLILDMRQANFDADFDLKVQWWVKSQSLGWLDCLGQFETKSNKVWSWLTLSEILTSNFFIPKSGKVCQFANLPDVYRTPGCCVFLRCMSRLICYNNIRSLLLLCKLCVGACKTAPGPNCIQFPGKRIYIVCKKLCMYVGVFFVSVYYL